MPAVTITLNGESRDIQEGWTVHQLVADLKLDDRPIAVERNREVIPKTRFGEVSLENGDRIEIVHFVGGG